MRGAIEEPFLNQPHFLSFLPGDQTMSSVCACVHTLECVTLFKPLKTGPHITQNGLKFVCGPPPSALLVLGLQWNSTTPTLFCVDYLKDCVKVQGIRPHQLNHHEGKGRG